MAESATGSLYKHRAFLVEGLCAAQKGQNREGLSPEMRAINTEKFHFHMSMRDRGEMGKWGWPNRIQQHT